MFDINDSVMYGNSGVCKIVDIRAEKFNTEEKVYYVLKPVYDDHSTIYCPIGSDKVKIRKLLSREEIMRLIQLMPDTETAWIENDQVRKEKFYEVLKRGDHEELVKLIKTLHYNEEERKKAGKKVHVADEKIMQEAEKILYSEFAHVLKISPDEVVPFIMGELENEDAAV